MGKKKNWQGSLALVKQPMYEKEKGIKIKNIPFIIDLVSHFIHGWEVG